MDLPPAALGWVNQSVENAPIYVEAYLAKIRPAFPASPPQLYVFGPKIKEMSEIYLFCDRSIGATVPG